MSVINEGYSFARKRVFSSILPSGVFDEITSGISYFKHIIEISENQDIIKDKVVHNLLKLTEQLFTTRGMVINFAGNEQDYSKFKNTIINFINRLKNIKIKNKKWNFKFTPDREAILIPGQVNYVVKGYDLSRLGFKFHGSFIVLKGLLSLDFLWNKIRVQGGAYGAFLYSPRNGLFAFHSYRDPNIEKTLKTYNEVADYLKNLNLDDRELLKGIIGAIGDLDKPLTPSLKADVSVSRYFANITYEDLKKEWDEVLSLKLDDLKSYSHIFEQFAKTNYYCVAGNEINIKENKNLFSNLIEVLK